MFCRYDKAHRPLRSAPLPGSSTPSRRKRRRHRRETAARTGVLPARSSSTPIELERAQWISASDPHQLKSAISTPSSAPGSSARPRVEHPVDKDQLQPVSISPRTAPLRLTTSSGTASTGSGGIQMRAAIGEPPILIPPMRQAPSRCSRASASAPRRIGSIPASSGIDRTGQPRLQRLLFRLIRARAIRPPRATQIAIPALARPPAPDRGRRTSRSARPT